MSRLSLVLFGFIVALNLSAVTATEVVQCKTTYRGKLKEPGVADHRSLCTLTTSFPDNSDMCLTTDTRGDNSGYFSVKDAASILCITFVYKEENVTEFVESVVLYRGVAQLTNAKTCSEVCTELNKLIGLIPPEFGMKIWYLGCDPKENSNDEDINKLDWSKPSPYTCKTPNNYAKPNDPDRPGPPAPITTTTTTTASTATSTSTTLTTKTIPGVTTAVPAASTGAPSWMWPVVGALIGILVLMAVLLVVEIVISRKTFNEVAKINPEIKGQGKEIPMY